MFILGWLGYSDWLYDVTQNFNGHQKLTQSQRLGLTLKLVNFDENTTYYMINEKPVKSGWKACESMVLDVFHNFL
jgi:hypothetical protein